jgi:hypothetical protein
MLGAGMTMRWWHPHLILNAVPAQAETQAGDVVREGKAAGRAFQCWVWLSTMSAAERDPTAFIGSQMHFRP